MMSKNEPSLYYAFGEIVKESEHKVKRKYDCSKCKMKAYLKRYLKTVEVITQTDTEVTFEPFYCLQVEKDQSGRAVAVTNMIEFEFLTHVELLQEVNK